LRTSGNTTATTRGKPKTGEIERCPMLRKITKTMKRGFIPVLLLALLWPTPTGGYLILLGYAVCAGAIWGAQASRTGKYFWKAGYTTVSRKVKYEN
jgi:hypothetical protein